MIKKSSFLAKRSVELGKLDYDKMIAHVNMSHPREVVTNEKDGTVEFQKLPLSTPIGGMMTSIFNSEPKWVQFDQLGLGVTLYFKMIKIMIFILCISTILSIPYLNAFA